MVSITKEEIMPKFMLIAWAQAHALARPDALTSAQFARCRDALARGGVLDRVGVLAAPSEGSVVHFAPESRLVVNGPYGRGRAAFSAFWIIKVPSPDVALVWARRLPIATSLQLEIRRVLDATDVPVYLDEPGVDSRGPHSTLRYEG